MPRPPKWNSPTESVRLPSHAISACLELAKALDQPLPEPEANSEFAEYTNFVQRAITPKLLTVEDFRESKVERHGYLMQCESPPTFEEFKQLRQVAAEVEERLFAGLTRDERLYLISRIAQEVFPEVELKYE